MHHREKVHELQKKILCAATKTQSSQKKKNFKEDRWELSRKKKKHKWWESVEDTFNLFEYSAQGGLLQYVPIPSTQD